MDELLVSSMDLSVYFIHHTRTVARYWSFHFEEEEEGVVEVEVEEELQAVSCYVVLHIKFPWCRLCQFSFVFCDSHIMMSCCYYFLLILNMTYDVEFSCLLRFRFRVDKDRLLDFWSLDLPRLLNTPLCRTHAHGLYKLKLKTYLYILKYLHVL